MTITHLPRAHYLNRPEGRIAYDDQGMGALVVCCPGMGDLRSTFRFQTAALVEAGYRVVTIDLRGHGDSDTTFTSYDDEAAASDLLALIEELGEPAVLVGSSMGAGAAVIAASRRPELVSGLVLVGPFVRNPPISKGLALLFRVMMARPWARLVWRAWVPSLYAGRKPDDFAAYRSSMIEAMRRRGYTRTFSLTTHTSHAPAEHAAAAVTAPSLVLMGGLDPDFSDPRAEAQWIGTTIGSDVVMIDDAGHYPQSQRPDVVNPAMLDFLGDLGRHA